MGAGMRVYFKTVFRRASDLGTVIRVWSVSVYHDSVEYVAATKQEEQDKERYVSVMNGLEESGALLPELKCLL